MSSSYCRKGAYDGSATSAAAGGPLLGGLAAVEDRVAWAVEQRRAAGAAPADPFRGLYVPPEDVDAWLGESVLDCAGHEPGAGRAPLLRDRPAPDSPLGVLRSSFGLSSLEIDVILIAVAPELDRRFERLYGYLSDDVAQRRATTGLALELMGLSPFDAEARGALSSAGRLASNGLLTLGDNDRPFLTRSLAVPDRVCRHLLGSSEPDPWLQPWIRDPVAVPRTELPDEELTAALQSPCPLTYVRREGDGAAMSYAAGVLSSIGVAGLFVDLRGAGPGTDASGAGAGPSGPHLAPIELMSAAEREAGLLGRTLVAGPVERLVAGSERDRPLDRLGRPAVITGESPWDPAWSATPAFVADIPPVRAEERDAVWVACLDGAQSDIAPSDLTSQFRLSPEEIALAARTAALRARVTRRTVSKEDLYSALRGQGISSVGNLARVVEPAARWSDLVLPEEVLTDLTQLCGRVRHRDEVLSRSPLPASGRGRGISALLVGASGTGKTLAAEVLAHELGSCMLAVDLTGVLDKYVGETEKNLDRIFTAAERSSALLLFDEADSLFATRSDVKGAQDRYANTETSYLLQRIESFRGFVVLTTNLRSVLDEAFTRRIDVLVDFPFPSAGDRARMWEKWLHPFVGRDSEISTSGLAESLELSGGSIRNIVLTAAHSAVAAGRPVKDEDIEQATHREFRKMGRLCDGRILGQERLEADR